MSGAGCGQQQRAGRLYGAHRQPEDRLLTEKNPLASSEKKRRRICRGDNVCTEHFAMLEEPHPYGVLPGGNRFLEARVQNAFLQRSPSDVLGVDECWLHVLAYCSGPDLARLATTCRFFYVVGHQPELWRDLCLRNSDKSVISQVGPSWRDTFVKIFHPDKYRGPHLPMRVQGVFSDYFYRLHSCRSFAIPDAWLDRNISSSRNSVARIDADQMTESLFKEFETANKPVLVESAAQHWKAFQRWNDRAYCRKHAGNRTFRATSGAAALSGNFTIDAYFDYCKSTHMEEAPLYLFDRSALKPGSHLWHDFMDGIQKGCPYWDPDRMSINGHDLFEILGEGRRPDHTWLIVGPRRSGSVFHIDPNATHAWNAAICGRKRWIFYPPGVTPPGIHPSQDGDHVTLPLSIGEWLFSFWEEHVERKRLAPPNERPLECTALPGDVMFVPHGWWHMVINMDEVNIAVTHNYVSDSNLSNVLKFLNTRRDQVSGCRDRGDSIKPGELYERFVDAMRLRDPISLDHALARPHWTCRAWKDVTIDDNQANQASTAEKANTREVKNNLMEQAKNDANGFKFSFL
jgi:hypothetical protein